MVLTSSLSKISSTVKFFPVWFPIAKGNQDSTLVSVLKRNVLHDVDQGRQLIYNCVHGYTIQAL